MLSGGVNPYNRDLYATNGYQLPLTIGGNSIKWVPDKDGILVQSPAGYPAMPGCRFADGVWYPTDSDGTSLFETEQLIRTPQGFVQVYEPSYQGIQIEPASTNIVQYPKMGSSGATAANWYSTLASRDKTTLTIGQPDPAGGNEALRIDVLNTAASALSAIIGTATSTTISVSFRYKPIVGSTIFILRNGATSTIGTPLVINAAGEITSGGNVWTRRVLPNGWFEFRHNADLAFSIGDTVWFYYGTSNVANEDKSFYIYGLSIESSPFVTSPILDGAGGTSTRLADPVSFATPSWLLAHPNDFWVHQRVIPEVSGGSQAIYSALLDTLSGADYIGIRINAASQLTLYKKVLGITYSIVKAYILLAETVTDILIYQSTIAGMGVAYRTWDGSVWVDWSTWGAKDDADGRKNAVIGSLFRIGSRTTDSLSFAATYPLTRIGRIPANLSTAEAIQAWLTAKVGA